MKKVILQERNNDNDKGKKHVVFFDDHVFDSLISTFHDAREEDELLKKIASALVKQLSPDVENKYYISRIKKNTDTPTTYTLLYYDQKFQIVDNRYVVDINQSGSFTSELFGVLETELKSLRSFFEKASQVLEAYLDPFMADFQAKTEAGDIPLNEPCPRPTLAQIKDVYTYTREKAARLFEINWDSLNTMINDEVSKQKSQRFKRVTDTYQALKAQIDELISNVSADSDDYDAKQLTEYARSLIEELKLNEAHAEMEAELEKESRRIGNIGTKPVEESVQSLFNQHEGHMNQLRHMKRLLAWAIYEGARNYYNHIIKCEPGTLEVKRTNFNDKFKCVGISICPSKRISSVEETYKIFVDQPLENLQELVRNLLKNCDTTPLLGVTIDRDNWTSWTQIPSLTTYSSAQTKLHEALKVFDEVCRSEFKNFKTHAVTVNTGPAASEGSTLLRLLRRDSSSAEKTAGDDNQPYYTASRKLEFTWGPAALALEKEISMELCAPIVQLFKGQVKQIEEQKDVSEDTCPGLFKSYYDEINRDGPLDAVLQNLDAIKVKIDGTPVAPRKKRMVDVETDLRITTQPPNSSVRQQINAKKNLLRLARLKEKTQNLHKAADEKVAQLKRSEANLVTIFSDIKIRTVTATTDVSANATIMDTIYALEMKARLISQSASNSFDELTKLEAQVAQIAENNPYLEKALAKQQNTPGSMSFWNLVIDNNNTLVSLYEKAIDLTDKLFFSSEAIDTVTQAANDAATEINKISLDDSELANTINTQNLEIQNAKSQVQNKITEAIELVKKLQTQVEKHQDKPVPLEQLTERQKTRSKEISDLTTLTDTLEQKHKEISKLIESASQKIAEVKTNVAAFQAEQQQKPVVKTCLQLIRVLNNYAYWDQKTQYKWLWGGLNPQPNAKFKIPDGIKMMGDAAAKYNLKKLNAREAQQLLDALKTSAIERKKRREGFGGWLKYGLFCAADDQTNSFYDHLSKGTIATWLSLHADALEMDSRQRARVS